MNIYTQVLKDVAKRAEELKRLSDSDITVTRSNPMCGDRVILDLKLEEGEVKFGIEVKGCLICQSSAVLLSEYCNQKNINQFNRFEHSVLKLINNRKQNESSINKDGTEGISLFSPLADHRMRHSCALLPIQALHDALESMCFKGEI